MTASQAARSLANLDNNAAEPRTFTSDIDPIAGQFLMDEWPDGSRTVAWRAAGWETWSPRYELKAVPVFGVVS